MNKNNNSGAIRNKLLIALALLGLAAAVSWFKAAQSPSVESSDTVAIGVQAPGSRVDVNAGETAAKNIKVASVDKLIDGLRARLEAEPGDVKGWILLARSYHHLQRTEESEQAYASAKALGYTGKPPVDMDSIPEPAAIRLDRANKLRNYVVLDPLDIRDKQSKQAGDQQHLDNNATSARAITVAVSMGTLARGEFPADATVFIFARPVAGGPPLAVARKAVHELPLRVTLDDSMAMIAGNTISSAGSVVAGARISKSGSPTRAIGDFEELSAPFDTVGKQTVELVINRKITETGSD